MIAWNAAALALQARARAGEKIPCVPLVHFALTVPQRWAVAGVPLVWGGYTWEALDIAVTGLRDEATQLADLEFMLPAVTPAQMALAAQDVEGTAVTVYRAWVDPADGSVADAKQVWTGRLDQTGWQDGGTAVARFRAVHRGNIALQPRASRYTDDEQRSLYSGDTSLNVDPMTDAASLVWPAASYFKV